MEVLYGPQQTSIQAVIQRGGKLEQYHLLLSTPHSLITTMNRENRPWEPVWLIVAAEKILFNKNLQNPPELKFRRRTNEGVHTPTHPVKGTSVTWNKGNSLTLTFYIEGHILLCSQKCNRDFGPHDNTELLPLDLFSLSACPRTHDMLCICMPKLLLWRLLAIFPAVVFCTKKSWRKRSFTRALGDGLAKRPGLKGRMKEPVPFPRLSWGFRNLDNKQIWNVSSASQARTRVTPPLLTSRFSLETERSLWAQTVHSVFSPIYKYI